MVGLSAEQKKFYQDNGYIVLKSVLPDAELDRISKEYNIICKRKKEKAAWGRTENGRKSNSTFNVSVKGIQNLHFHHAVFGQYLYNDHFLDAIEDIMGSRNIMLHHTFAPMHSSEPKAPYPMHQDYHYFPYEKHSPVLSLLHLDDVDPDNGVLHVYPGSHKLGPQEDVGATVGNYHYLDQNKFPMSGAVPVLAERGDMIIFSYLLIHGGTGNSSSHPRRLLLTQLVDAEDEPVGQHQLKPQGWLLRGCKSKPKV